MVDDDDLTAEKAENAAPAQPAKKIAGKSTMLYAILGVLFLIGCGAGLYFSGVLGEKDVKKGEATAAIDNSDLIFYEVPEILVNLQNDSRRPNFLKINLKLELYEEGDKARLDTVMPRVIDSFQMYLRELRMDDLRGSSGMYRLREELLMRLNQAAHPVKIKDVLFQDMLVQ